MVLILKNLFRYLETKSNKNAQKNIDQKITYINDSFLKSNHKKVVFDFFFLFSDFN